MEFKKLPPFDYCLVNNREHRHRRERWSWNTSLTPVGGHRLFETGRIRLELGMNMNICREDRLLHRTQQ